MKDMALKKLTKIGKTSYGLVLPKEMLKDLEINPDDDLLMIYKDKNSIKIIKYNMNFEKLKSEV